MFGTDGAVRMTSIDHVKASLRRECRQVGAKKEGLPLIY